MEARLKTVVERVCEGLLPGSPFRERRPGVTIVDKFERSRETRKEPPISRQRCSVLSNFFSLLQAALRRGLAAPDKELRLQEDAS